MKFRKTKFFLGTFFIIFGLLVFTDSVFSITGLVIFEDAGLRTGYFIGILFIFGGAVLLTSAVGNRKGQKLELIVGDSSHGEDKNHDRAYFIQDSRMELGENHMTLGRFKTEINKIKEEDKSGEMYGIVKQIYVPSLEVISKEGSPEQKRVADEFLGIFDVVKKEGEVKEYHLSKEEREEIKNAFRDRQAGNYTQKQREVLSKYGLQIKSHYGGKHTMIISNSGKKIPLSWGSGGPRGGLNNAHNIIRFIEEEKKREESSH